MPGFNPERAIQALINNIAETEAKGVINGTHLMRALGAIGDYCKIYSLTQISGAPCDELRVEIGGLIRLFSDFVLSGRIEDYETFAKKGIELSFTCSSPGRLTPEEVDRLLNQAPKRRGLHLSLRLKRVVPTVSLTRFAWFKRAIARAGKGGSYGCQCLR